MFKKSSNKEEMVIIVKKTVRMQTKLFKLKNIKIPHIIYEYSFEMVKNVSLVFKLTYSK